MSNSKQTERLSCAGLAERTAGCVARTDKVVPRTPPPPGRRPARGPETPEITAGPGDRLPPLTTGRVPNTRSRVYFTGLSPSLPRTGGCFDARLARTTCVHPLITSAQQHIFRSGHAIGRLGNISGARPGRDARVWQPTPPPPPPTTGSALRDQGHDPGGGHVTCWRAAHAGDSHTVQLPDQQPRSQPATADRCRRDSVVHPSGAGRCRSVVTARCTRAESASASK